MTQEQQNFLSIYGNGSQIKPVFSPYQNSYSALPNIYNTVSDPINPNNISLSNGIQRGELKIGGLTVNVSVADDIQSAINKVNNAGGGVVILSNGIHSQKSALTLYSNIELRGQNAGSAILDFASTGSGISMTGTNVYSTGTITSISAGVNVTGSGTSWSSSMVGQQIFISNRWYVIRSVTDTTHLVLATGYADGATYSGTYRISSVIANAAVSNLTIKNATGTGISGTDVRDFSFRDTNILSCNMGFSLSNFMSVVENVVTIASCTSDGYQLTNGSFNNGYSFASVSNGGNGATLNNIKTCGFILSACDSNTGDGVNATNVTNTDLLIETSGNGGKGINLVSGCNGNSFNSILINANTSDGVRITSSSTNAIYSADITNNGGWGINITDSNSRNNILINPYYSGNASGTLSDSGTNTTIISNAMTTLGDLIYGGTNGLPTRLGIGTQGQLLNVSAGLPAWVTYAGSTSVTTLGTITTGTWNGTVITPVFGGTGVANGTKNSITFSGNFGTTITLSSTTSVTLPTTGTLATLAGTETFTNKRITARVFTSSSTTSIAPEKATYDIYHVTALASAITIGNPPTTPNDGDQIRLRFLDNGTARAISFSSQWVAKGGVALPTTTTLSKNLELGFEWNANLSAYNLLASAQE